MGMNKNISRVLYHESTILSRLNEMAHSITSDYKDKELTVIAVLNGSFIFMADLLRRIPLQLQVDTCSASSYKGTKSTGTVTTRLELADVSNRHVLLLDDIYDSGLTIKAIAGSIAKNGPLSIKSCALLSKAMAKGTKTDADYVGFQIPDAFVVGYGLDYNEKFRNLPYIGIISDEAIARYAE